MALGISQVGLSDSDSHRLRTILAMVMMNSPTAREKWVSTDATAANLVVTDVESSAGQELIDSSKDNEGLLVAVLAGEADKVPEGCLKLAWPSRVEELLRLLITAQERLEQFESSPSALTEDAQGGSSGLVQVASMIRDSDEKGSNTAWRIDGLSSRPVYISPGDSIFCFGGSLIKLRALDPKLQASFVPVPIEDINAKHDKKPLVMLQWLIGLQTGQFGPLPWMDKDMAIKLRRYPAFHILHHSSAHRRIAAVLSRPRRNMENVANLARVDLADVHSFINASSLCGYLQFCESKPQKGARSSGSSSRPRAFFNKLRNALGIEPVNV